jgi:hypothetical protein
VNLSRASGLPFRPDPQLLKAVGNPLNNLGLPERVAKIR